MTDRAESLAPSRRFVRGDETGAALLEFSLVFGLFVFILYGLITFGVILAQKQAVTNAASDGARAGVGAVSPATAAQSRVEQALGAPNGRYTALYTTGACTGGTGTCLTVTVTWDYENHPLVPPAPGIGVVTPDAFGATAVVQVS